MKPKYFLLGFVFFNILILSTVVQAENNSKYSLGIQKDMEITLDVKVFDKDGLKDIFDDGWSEVIPEGADEVGNRYRIKVLKVDKDAEIDLGLLGEYDAYCIEANVWEWIKGEFAEDPTDEEKEIVWFKDPEDINDAYGVVGGYAFDIEMPFVPISVVKFLDRIDEWKEDRQEEWKTKDNMVIHDSIFNDENFVEIYTYDENNGFLTGYKIKNEKGVIIYEYGLSLSIPGYEIPIILGIAGLTIIGLIYIIKKKL